MIPAALLASVRRTGGPQTGFSGRLRSAADPWSPVHIQRRSIFYCEPPTIGWNWCWNLRRSLGHRGNRPDKRYRTIQSDSRRGFYCPEHRCSSQQYGGWLRGSCLGIPCGFLLLASIAACALVIFFRAVPETKDPETSALLAPIRSSLEQCDVWGVRFHLG